MKRSERLNKMLRFINRKQRFTLADLMTEFQISKRTALRDIQSLEEIGAPIYAQYGRHGGYVLLNPMQLPALPFTFRELVVLSLAMQTLEHMGSSSDQASVLAMLDKVVRQLPADKQQMFEQLQRNISIHQTPPLRENAQLEPLMQAAVDRRVLRIRYRKDTQASVRHIQPIGIYARGGFWYCPAYDVDKQAYRVFRCDRIESAEIAESEPLVDLRDIHLENRYSLWKPSKQAIHFKCRITRQGIERFREESYPSMGIIEEAGQWYLAGTYEPHEEAFIVKYLAGFGTSVSVLEPALLKTRLKQYCLSLLEHVSGTEATTQS